MICGADPGATEQIMKQVVEVQTLRNHFPGFVVLGSCRAQDQYERALDAFAQGGRRSDLLQCLMGLGVPAGDIRWLAEVSGRRKMSVVGK